MKLSRENLPDIAKKFLRSKRDVWTWATIDRTASPIGQLHEWLSKNGIEIQEATVLDLQKFMQFCRDRNLKRESFRVLSSGVCHYLEWLKAKGIIRIKLYEVFPRSNICAKPLPSSAQSFLRAMSINLAPHTVNYYQNCVRGLHEFIRKNKLPLKSLNRKSTEKFMISLHEQGLSTASRVQWLIAVRVYLRWLNDHDLLKENSDYLIRITDFPRVPEYLPRPLPADVDRELQRRLSKSNHIYWKALLLMRLTGIRVSEMLSLTYDCVRTDPDGNKFLKVELGKLKNERLVPIDSKTADLVESIQTLTREIQEKFHRGAEPELLVSDPEGRRINVFYIREALNEATQNLKTKEPITSHRLRHSYATQLLGAGVSIFSLMRILGHRHFKMTLRYAAITQETIRKEYNSAIEKIDKELDLFQANPESREILANPQEVLPDLVRWLRQTGSGD